MICPNKNDKVFIELSKYYDELEIYQIFIDNGYDLPSMANAIKLIEDKIKLDKSKLLSAPEETFITPNIKPGVAELFESNQDLANAVYEVLGFNDFTRNENDFTNDNEFYRVIVGDAAFNDIVESGVVRTNAETKGKKEGGIDLSNRPTAYPSFSKGKASMDYAAENPNNYIIVTEDSSIQPSKVGRHGKGTTMFPTDENGNHLKELDGNKVKVYKHVGNGKYELVYNKGSQITPQQKQQAISLYSQYLEQNPNGSVEQFESWVDEFNKKTNIQGAYDFSASSNSGKWNSANNELLNLVQDNRKAFAIYKFLIGDMETFKEIVDFLNEKGIKIPYTDRMKRADETMTIEERKSAIDSYNNSVDSKVKDKVQVEKDILSENNLQDETDYTPQELIEKYPLTGVQKVIWDLIKDIVNKLGIKVKFSSSRITEGFDGSNNPQNGEILIRPSTLKNGRFGEVLVHEIVHSLTTKIISRVNSGVTTGLTQKQINAVKGLMKLFKAIKADNNLENKYPVKDVFEFIAHLTNEKFVKELESKDKNFLQKVVDFILDIVGITNANELSKKYLLDIISDGVFLQENGVTVLPSDYGSNVQASLSDFITQKSQERLKAIQEVFNSNPELSKVGDVFSYAIYLDTIFPDSKVKDIVYHGSDNIFETFDKNVLGKNTQAESAKKGFFFSKNPKTSEDYIEFSPKRLKIEPASTLQGYEGETRLINKYRDKIPSNYIKKDIIYEEGFREEIEIINPQYRKDVESILPGIFKYNVYHDNSERNIGDAFANPLNYIKKLVTYQEAKDFIEDIKKSNEMSKLYMTVLDIKNPMLFSDNANIQRQNTYSERINKALSNKNDSVIIENTFDPYPNLTDIYVVFEPEQIHILGGKQDIDGFKQFVQNKQSITPRKGISELFAENPQLASIGTQEQYERYLSTIFPNSKVKDIVYHGTPDDIQEFDKTKSQVSDVLYFSNDKEDAEGYRKRKRSKIVWTTGVFEYNGFRYAYKYDQDKKEYYYLKKDINIGSEKLDTKTARLKYETTQKEFDDAANKVLSGGKVIASLLNIKNLYNGVGEDLFFGGAESFKEEGYDGFITNDDGGRPSIFAVFEPEQIHILGSKQDIEGFKQFVSSRLGQQGNIFYQNLSESNLQDYVASEKTIRDLAARMSDRIGIPVLFEFDTTKEYKGKLENNTAIINLAYATLDTPIHEILGHPIIRAIRNKKYEDGSIEEYNDFMADYWEANPEKSREEVEKYVTENFKSKINSSKLYENLLKELEYGKGKEVLDRIKRDYDVKTISKNYSIIDKSKNTDLEIIQNFGTYWFKEYNEVFSRGKQFDTNEELQSLIEREQNKIQKYTLEEQQEEAIVELLGLYTADRLDKVKDGKLISLLKRLLKEMKAFMKSLFNQKEVEIDKLPDNMTLGDLADLLAYSNSKLILPGNEVLYTIGDGLKFKTYAEINNHIKELARQAAKYENVDLSKVEIDKEDIYLKRFLEADKEYAQAREIIDTWKEVNDIQYNPEEAYSRGQEFIHVHNAYGNTDTITWLQNLIPNLEDINKANGVMEMSFLTYFQGKLPKHVTRNLNEKAVIKIIAYPKSKDIAFASKIDNHTSSYSIDSEGLQYFIDLSNISKREQLAVSYTKSVKLRNIGTIEPNIADTIDNVAHHNEYAINIADGNFRIEYGKETPYDIKKLIDNINSILDQKYGKLVKSEIKKVNNKKLKLQEELADLNENFEAVMAVTSLEDIDDKVFDELSKKIKDKELEIKNLKEYQIGIEENIIEEFTYKVQVLDDDGYLKAVVKSGFKTLEEAKQWAEENKDDYIKWSGSFNYEKVITKKIGIEENQIVKYGLFSKEANDILDEFDTEKEAQTAADTNNKRLLDNGESEDYSVIPIKKTGIQPTQTNETLKVKISDIKYDKNIRRPKTLEELEEGDLYLYREENGKYYKENLSTQEDIEITKEEYEGKKEYTSQALINTKVATLKQVAKKYPRSLIRSEVVKIKIENYNKTEEDLFDIPFQKISTNKDLANIQSNKSTEISTFAVEDWTSETNECGI